MTRRHATLRRLADDLSSRRVTSAKLVGDCLARAESETGEAAFISLSDASALQAAMAVDRKRTAREPLPLLAGIPISIKDLFDVQGEETRAGSIVLRRGPAGEDAIAVSRLKQAGLISVGRTNMTEFAYSGLGANPHFGTPTTPWRRQERRIAGGSTSGGAVSVAEEMAYAALGTDTGGSCRIPAAFCGIAGFKSSARRDLFAGMVPLSSSLDSLGWMANSVQCLADINSAITENMTFPRLASVAPTLRLLLPTNLILEGADPEVIRAFKRAVALLKAAGAIIVRADVKPFEDLSKLAARGTLVAAEAYSWHKRMMEDGAAAYDPNVLARIMRGASMTGDDYQALLAAREKFVEAMSHILADFDALIMPTVAILPPKIAELENAGRYQALNALILRNPAIVNLFDGCAVSIPITSPDAAPVGLSFAAPKGRDMPLLALSNWAEAVFRPLVEAPSHAEAFDF
ncbi:MAG TPA: amidase [Rhizomicrobium sp.]|jgi:aspartyl-tRNA(Asn)/glutamyl-tRNA(Gln) amidotransferase subunit A